MSTRRLSVIAGILVAELLAPVWASADTTVRGLLLDISRMGPPVIACLSASDLEKSVSVELKTAPADISSFLTLLRGVGLSVDSGKSGMLLVYRDKTWLKAAKLQNPGKIDTFIDLITQVCQSGKVIPQLNFSPNLDGAFLGVQLHKPVGSDVIEALLSAMQEVKAQFFAFKYPDNSTRTCEIYIR